MTTPTEQIETQAETITRYQRENDRPSKQVDTLIHNSEHAQAHIRKLKAKNALLETQLTDAAKADWILRMNGHGE